MAFSRVRLPNNCLFYSDRRDAFAQHCNDPIGPVATLVQGKCN